MSDGASKYRVAAVGDLHCREGDHARLRELVKAANAEADALLLCGDLTDRGLPEEAKTLAEAAAGLSIPCAAVLGNHDFETNMGKDVCKALHDVGVTVLDGDHVIFDGEVGVAGIKGFGGGFGHAMLQAFGEGPIKAFVQEAVNEALKLEAALGQLDTEKRICLMHYAPIAETTEGEHPEVRPYLGSSRLAAAVDSYGANFVVHGHAHHGKDGEGRPRLQRGAPADTKALRHALSHHRALIIASRRRGPKQRCKGGLGRPWCRAPLWS